MTPSKCPECGAGLPAKAGPHVCKFCKHEVDIVDERAPVIEREVVVVTPPAAPAPRSFAGLRSLGVFVVIAGITVVSAWPAIKLGIKSTGLVAAAWDGKTTFECSGNEDITLEDKKVDLAGSAIIVGGNCQLRLRRCDITGDIAVEVGGNGRVIVEDTAQLHGRKQAVVAGANAHVELRGPVTGAIKRSANARVNR